MRDLRTDELGHVYGAGGKSRSCYDPCSPRGKGSKSKKSKSKRSKSKHSKSKGSKGYC